MEDLAFIIDLRYATMTQVPRATTAMMDSALATAA